MRQQHVVARGAVLARSACWTNYFVTMSPLQLNLPLLCIDLLLACYLANATCAIINIMTTLIFVILIVSRLHAFFLVAPVRSSLHVLMAVAVISYFQHLGHHQMHRKLSKSSRMFLNIDQILESGETTRWLGIRATWNFLSGIPDFVKQNCVWECFFECCLPAKGREDGLSNKPVFPQSPSLSLSLSL